MTITDLQLTIQLILAGTFFLAAILLDLFYHKIPNLLSFTAIICGLLCNGYFAQLEGLLNASYGLSLALIVLLPVFILRVLGGGDVKLMMGIGALMGPHLLLWSLAYAVAAGAITSLCLVLYKVGIKGILTTISRYKDCLLLQTYFKPDANEAAGQKVPYAPALAIGWAYACAMDAQIVNLYHFWQLELGLGGF